MTAQGPRPGSEPLAVLSLVLGILSIFSAWCCLGFLLGPLGVVLGAVAFSRSPRGARGLAIAGLATSGAGLLLCVLFQVVGLAFSLWSRP
jgi:hypothetical protein